MVQNHLMQLLAITAMEPPAKFDKNGFFSFGQFTQLVISVFNFAYLYFVQPSGCLLYTSKRRR